MSRQTLITLQPAPIVDGYAPDGSEMTKLPYPVHAWASDGVIPQHLGGYTDPKRIIGFTDEMGRQTNTLVLPWRDAVKREELTEGMFIVCEMPDGSGMLLSSPVESVQMREFERPEVIDPLVSALDSDHRRQGWS